MDMRPARQADIREKLGFAHLKLRSLHDELHKARAEEKSVEFIGQKVGEILSACRECFDYAAHDVSEAFVSNQPNQLYFPFNVESLARAPWPALKSANPSAYHYLENLITKIAANEAIPGTILGYKRIREINSLVNDKKHDRITRVKRPDNASTLVDFGGQMMAMSPVFPFDGAVPDFGAEVQAETMIGNHPDIEIKYVSEYHIDANNWEAGRYCSHAVDSSWLTLDDLYVTLFGSDRNTLDPAETTKPPEQRAFEALVQRVSPIITRLVVVGFFNGDVQIDKVDISFDGEVSPKSVDNQFIADYFRDVFSAHGWNAVRPQFEQVLREGGLARAESDNFEPKYMEVNIQTNKGAKSLGLPSGRVLSFNHCVWGLLTKFRHSESDGFTPSWEAMQRAVEFFGLTFKTVVGTTPIGLPPAES